MGAGVLPVTIMKGTIFFLLGQEKSSRYWSDFGGSSNTYESVYETAIREGYEELDGFFGTKSDFETIVSNNLIEQYFTKRYTTFLFYVKPQLLLPLPYYFNNHHKFITSEVNFVKKEHDGLFEKTNIKLFNKADLLKNYNDIRPFYKDIVDDLLELQNEKFDKYI